MNVNNDKDINEKRIVFKKRKNLGQRRQKPVDCDNESNDWDQTQEGETTEEWDQLRALRELQKSKRRVNRGINIVDLCPNPAKSTSNVSKDSKSGGLLDMKNLSNELDLGNTFSVETNRRDEDTDLMKYIEEELNKRKRCQQSNNNKQSLIPNTVTKNETINSSNLTEDMLFSVLPEHLLKNNVKKSEEMLSNQMLNGIPEVELGIEERIRNIEATEDAKMRLIESKKNKVSKDSSSFVPNNIAVCFVHHNRYNMEEEIPHMVSNAKRQRTDSQQQTKSTYVEEPVVVIGDEPKHIMKLQSKGSEQNHNKFHGKDKATDDYIFEKFKKQFRKF